MINESALLDRGLWKKSFKDVFNQFSKIKVGDLPGNPSVSHIVYHYHGVKEINHLLFAPDGSPLLSKDDFVKIIPRYMKVIIGHENSPEVHYPNGNIILMPLLIEAMSGRHLGEISANMSLHLLGCIMPT
jgi:hypothetical protein